MEILFDLTHFLSQPLAHFHPLLAIFSDIMR